MSRNFTFITIEELDSITFSNDFSLIVCFVLSGHFEIKCDSICQNLDFLLDIYNSQLPLNELGSIMFSNETLFIVCFVPSFRKTTVTVIPHSSSKPKKLHYKKKKTEIRQ